MLINRNETINRLIEAGTSYADVIELLQGEPEKADAYREAFTHAIGILNLMDSQNVVFAADLEITGTFDDLGRCGGCKKTIGSLSFIYDSEIGYCPFCGAKLHKEEE
jgi:rRNA maturation endonuclease Nob1